LGHNFGKCWLIFKILSLLDSEATPRNTQNDRLYAPVASKKRHVATERMLQTRSSFSKSMMVFVGVSKLGKTDLTFVDPGVQINSTYYRDVLLTQHLLSVMREISGQFFIFQLQHTECVRQSAFSGTGDTRVHFTRLVASQKFRPEPS